MKFQIMHESKGRVRLRAVQNRMSIEQADLLEAWLVLVRKLSEKLMKRIDRNYRFVLGFNGMLILLGAFGILAPSASALLHNTSTLLLSLDCMTDLMPKR